MPPAVTISPEYRKRFEAIGLEDVERELVIGNGKYLIMGRMREEAQEWVPEERQRIEKLDRRRRRNEALRYYGMLGVTVIGALAAVVAAVFSILGPIH